MIPKDIRVLYTYPKPIDDAGEWEQEMREAAGDLQNVQVPTSGLVPHACLCTCLYTCTHVLHFIADGLSMLAHCLHACPHTCMYTCRNMCVAVHRDELVRQPICGLGRDQPSGQH